MNVIFKSRRIVEGLQTIWDQIKGVSGNIFFFLSSMDMFIYFLMHDL